VATLADAEAARLAHQDRIGAFGAHAIEIQPLRRRGEYELIVHFAAAPTALPRSVVVRCGTRSVAVPLRAVIWPEA
jgi:hypothetical protein